MDAEELISLVNKYESLKDQRTLVVGIARSQIAYRLEEISRGKGDEVRRILDGLLACGEISKHSREWLDEYVDVQSDAE